MNIYNYALKVFTEILVFLFIFNTNDQKGRNKLKRESGKGGLEDAEISVYQVHDVNHMLCFLIQSRV